MARKQTESGDSWRRGRTLWMLGLVSLLGASLVGALYAGGVLASASPPARSQGAMTPLVTFGPSPAVASTNSAAHPAAREIASATAGGVTITGTSSTLFYPGTTVAVNLSFDNSSAADATVSGVTVTVRVATTNPGCDGATNYALENPDTPGGNTLTFPSSFVVPAGATKSLSQFGVPSADWPQITMLNLPVNQDACSGATFSVDYGYTSPAGAALVPATIGHPTFTLTPKTQEVLSGKKATFKISVKNTAKVTLTGVKIKDPLATACARSLGTLAVGATRSYSCSRSNVKAAFENAATLTGKTKTGTAISTTVRAKVTLAFTPALSAHLAIALTPKTQTLQIGTKTKGLTTSITYPNAHFKIKVTNEGTAALHAVSVAGALAQACHHTIGSLPAHASRSYSCVDALVTSGSRSVAVATGKSPTGSKLTARAKATVKVVTSSGVTVTTNRSGKTVTLSIPDVLFAFNESTLGPGAQHALATVLALLNHDYKTQTLTITGYTDSVGSAAYNLGLSQRRATTVATWLEQHGIQGGRVTIAWMGESDPVASNATAAGRAKNRRVTITIRTGH